MIQAKNRIFKCSPVLIALMVLVLAGCDASDPADGTDSASIQIHDTISGASLGTITVVDTEAGAVFTPTLTGLFSGQHGFHVHENPDCGMNGRDAGGHYDPGNTGRHEGPYGNGHLGDLPVLVVASSGAATGALLAPRVRVGDLEGRSVIIHGGGDNYSDMPASLGGGGARVACGIVSIP